MFATKIQDIKILWSRVRKESGENINPYELKCLLEFFSEGPSVYDQGIKKSNAKYKFQSLF